MVSGDLYARMALSGRLLLREHVRGEPCICHAHAMHMPCICHAHAMHMPCICACCSASTSAASAASSVIVLFSGARRCTMSHTQASPLGSAPAMRSSSRRSSRSCSGLSTCTFVRSYVGRWVGRWVGGWSAAKEPSSFVAAASRFSAFLTSAHLEARGGDPGRDPAAELRSGLGARHGARRRQVRVQESERGRGVDVGEADGGQLDERPVEEAEVLPRLLLAMYGGTRRKAQSACTCRCSTPCRRGASSRRGCAATRTWCITQCIT